MRHLTANAARKDFDAVLGEIARFNEPVTVVSDDSGAAVIISMDEWNSIQETLYLHSIPGLVESIKTSAEEPLEYGIPASECISASSTSCECGRITSEINFAAIAL